MQARERRDRHRVLEQIVLEVDPRRDRLEAQDVARVEHGSRRRRVDPVRLEHLRLFARGRVPHRDAHEEAVDLRLGQRIRALEVDRVLRGQDEERRGQLEPIALDGDLALLHRLEQRALRLGRARG